METDAYNSKAFEIYGGNWGSWTGVTYWLLSVIERAQSTDPEKIIKIWEGDTYKFVNGKVMKMRVCDHKAIEDGRSPNCATGSAESWRQQLPYHRYKGCSFYGPTAVVPAAKVLPWMDQKLDRCAGKNGWGE